MAHDAPEGTRLFVGNLSWNTTDESLEKAFSSFNVVDAKVVKDRFTGESRGFGFVTLSSVNDATEAQEKMHDQDIDGRVVRVNVATPPNR